MNNDEQFFYDNAGFGWNPLEDESQEAGHVRCAIALAKAEKIASDAGVQFSWTIDEFIDSSDYDDDEIEAHSLWQVAAQDAEGNVFTSLGGVDFTNGEPWEDDYKRVVEAELALEYEPPIILEVTFNSGYYVVKDGTREAQYRAEDLNATTAHYEGQVKRAKRALEDLEAIAQYMSDKESIA